MRRALIAAAVLAAALLFAAAASASTLPLTSVPSHNMAPVCPGGYLASAQDGDATPPAPPPTCGLSTMTGSSWLYGQFTAPPSGGTVVVSAYVNTVDRATTMSLLINGGQVGQTIALTSGTRQWWSFSSVQVLPTDTLEVSFTFGAGSTSTVTSMHAEFTPNPTTDLGSLIARDMTQPGDLYPEGVPSDWNWYAQGVVTDAADLNGWSYGNPWGQVYIAGNGNSFLGPDGETLWVDVRNLNAWVLNTVNGVSGWDPIYGQSPPVLGGALYPEDFSSGSITGNFTRLSPTEIEVAPKCATCAPATAKGYLFHFFPNQSRAWLHADEATAVCSSAEIRLDPSDPVTAYQPGLIANVGFDWWSAPSGGTANGAGESRFKTVTRSWRELVFCTTGAGAPLPPITVDPGELF